MTQITRHRLSLLHIGLLGFATLVVPAAAHAQHQLNSGRITKSFTEPIERSVAASAEVGIIAVAHVKEGDRVTVGDPLAEINQNVLQRSLKIAQARAESTARLDAAESQLELLKSQLEALNSLVEGGHTNRYEVEQKDSEYRQAYAEFRSAEEEIQLAKLEVKRIQAQIGDRTIKSPINGLVTEIHKQLGENVSNSEPQYATIVRVDELKVRFYLDATTLKRAQVGDQVTVHVGRDQTQATATIIFVSPIINPDSGLGRLEIKIENHAFDFQSGVVCFWGRQSLNKDQDNMDAQTQHATLKRLPKKTTLR